MITIDRIQLIDAWLRTHRPDYYELLQPGETTESLDAFASQMSVVLPDEFILLYRWHDGQKPREFTPLLDNLTFMTLNESIEMKNALDEVARIDLWHPDHWRRDWIPFLDNGGGDLMCFDLGGYATGNRNQLIWFDHESELPEIIHPDADEFLDDLFDRMTNGNLNLS